MNTSPVSVFNSAASIISQNMRLIERGLKPPHDRKENCRQCLGTGHVQIGSTTAPEENEWVECLHGAEEEESGFDDETSGDDEDASEDI